uniref:NADPH--hemoprotein reductase n=1 Tax=Ciona savignyi TaxID=51511 RepID=H2YK29_CIOSA
KTQGRNIAILYGSQTGTGEEFANRLAKDAQRYGMKALVLDPEECNADDLPQLIDIPNSLVLMCMATYGEGDPTDNAQDFHDWLKQGDTMLTGLRYAVFGLGNKTYEHYNSMGKFVDKRFEELGAERVYELGLGDDDTNIEEDFVTWKEGLWPAVCQRFGLEASMEDGSFRAYSFTKYEDGDLDPKTIYTGEVARLHSYDNQRPLIQYSPPNPYLSHITDPMMQETLLSNPYLPHITAYLPHITDPMMQETLLSNPYLPYITAYLPHITDHTMQVSLLSNHHLPHITLYLPHITPLFPPYDHLFTPYNPPFTPPYRPYDAKNPYLAPIQKLYQEWVVDSRRTLLAVLTDLPSCQPPIDHICELLPRLQARYYSIASSPRAHPNSIHICAVVVKYETKAGYTNLGVATNWLTPIYVRKSQFRLPFKVSHPVVMIGPGTGAPFIGFIQDRAYHKEAGKDVGKTILYFGCRKRSEDFIYGDQLDEWKSESVLTELNLAFSRDGEKKVYVQHLIAENRDSLWKVIEGHGHIYVCGDARHMARDVHDAIVSIVEEKAGKTHQQAVDFVKGLMNKGRYSADVWS